MRTLNLGILAHVDAGKTTLTERLLYAAGVIDAPGSVDDGSTQTDSLELERRRGITIKSAVVSFVLDDVTVNLIDTPGHPDFIAEVERVLGVLDGAVLVLSAVEGVQAQTRLLMRALRRLRVPTLLFVNKIDRVGAREEGVLREILQKLTPAVVAMGLVTDLGTLGAHFVPYDAGDAAFTSGLIEVLAEHDETLLRAYVEDAVSYERLRAALRTQTAQTRIHPVLFGSAKTGAGVGPLAAAIVELLPAAEGDAGAPVSGTIFKVERGGAGEKVAYVRMSSGTLRTRGRVSFGREEEETVTSIRVFEDGGEVGRGSVTAGRIAKLWGLKGVRIGDAVGGSPATSEHHFAPPTLETVVVPADPARRGALNAALIQLAEQDPLIGFRLDDAREELVVSLYGEVQKEVIGATLADEYGIDVDFRETTTICVERPVGTGAAVEVMRQAPNPFLATVGLRVEPAPGRTGVVFERDKAVFGKMPAAFFTAVQDSVHRTLRQGLYGWEVTDCRVTMTHADYSPRQSHAHQGFSKAMSSTGEDYRGLTPLVLMKALKRAGTVVCEPIHRFRLEGPEVGLGEVFAALAELRAVPDGSVTRGSTSVVEGEIPAASMHELQLRLRALTRGEGLLEFAYARHAPVVGEPQVRQRTDHNPLHRKEYLLHVLRRV